MSSAKMAQGLFKMGLPKIDLLGGTDFFNKEETFDLDEIRSLLDDGRPSQKLEAIKRLVAVRRLFPSPPCPPSLTPANDSLPTTIDDIEGRRLSEALL